MKKPQVLVVEDEGIVAKSIQNMLRNLGYGSSGFATSGEMAIQKAEETQPDLILMDIRLKGTMDGVEAAQEIHRMFGIPIVYLTAYGDEKTLERAKISEPFGYLLKPFEEQDLHSTIEMALYKSKMEKKREELHRKLKESQAQLIQTEKMAAMGTMTAGLAHELNNPLMSILNFVLYAQKHTSRDHRIYPVLRDAETETRRCVDIIHNLLMYSRMEGSEEKFKKENLAVILERILKVLSSRIKSMNVLITRKISNEVPKIWILENNLQQVIFNIMGNALDAVKEVETKKVHIDVQKKGKYCQVLISDSGTGIALEDQSKIFDPFFTTKSAGEGTGLGLSICQSIVKAHGGTISFDSKPGKGTTFKILLPIERRKSKEGVENV